MEHRTVRLNFDLSFVYGPRTWRAPIAAVMLLAAVGDLNSESVTLSTYYPAPSGVYTQMITTGNTFLARDGGAVTKVGIGMTNPGAKLDVGVGASQCCAPAGVTPNISLAQASNTNGQMAWLQFHNSGESEAYIRLAGAGAGLRAGSRRLEIGDNQGVGTNLTVAGYVKVTATGCSAPVTVTNSVICGAGQYATFSPGLYVEGTSYQNHAISYLLTPTGTRIYKALGLVGTTPTEMPLYVVESAVITCCPK